MSDLPEDMAELIKSDKSLGDAPLWDEKSNPLYVVFTHSLTVGSVTTGGFQLRVKVSKRWVDSDAVITHPLAAG